MRTLTAALLISLSTLAFAQRDPQQTQQELARLSWQKGPGSGQLAGKAQIAIPENYLFLDAQNTRRFLELTGNPPRDGNYTYAPSSLNWFAIFSFADSGYVKDDEKINPDELLRSLKESDAPSMRSASGLE